MNSSSTFHDTDTFFANIIILGENVLLFSALVPSGTDVILDLNGQTINRNLTEPAAGGSVFRVEGRLTIMDSSDNEAGKIARRAR